MNRFEKQELVDKYYKLENDLILLIGKNKIPENSIYEYYSSLPKEVKNVIKPILEEQIALLSIFRDWELEKYGNVIQLPTRSLRK